MSHASRREGAADVPPGYKEEPAPVADDLVSELPVAARLSTHPFHPSICLLACWLACSPRLHARSPFFLVDAAPVRIVLFPQLHQPSTQHPLCARHRWRAGPSPVCLPKGACLASWYALSRVGPHLPSLLPSPCTASLHTPPAALSMLR